MVDAQDILNCTRCRKPKQSAAAGSITQWVSVCRCDLVSRMETAAASEEQLRVCATCRKRVNAAKGGSITQWIFSENFCKCEKLVLLPFGEGAPGYLSGGNGAEDCAGAQGDSIDEEVVREHYLEVDAEHFPVERYKPMEFIGKGALGEVYLCRDVLLRKKVAVKRLVLLTDDSVVSFQNEAKIASKLKHPNVISVLDFGTTSGGRPFMVMEYFPGISLANLIANAGRVEERDAVDIFLPICRSLQYLHDNGVMHRDLKPSNVLVSVNADGRIDVRLIDFGLSKTNQEHQSRTLLNGHTIVGTPEYMSPDQAQGKRYDAQSEVYSLGCLMFETLTGRQPFTGETALEILNKHVQMAPPMVRDLNGDVSVELSAAVQKCLEKKKEERFQTIKQVENSLARASGYVEELSVGMDAPAARVRLQPRSDSVFNRIAVVISALAVAGLVVSGMVWFIGKNDGNTLPSTKLENQPYLGKKDEKTAMATSPELFGNEAFDYADYPKDLESGDLPTGLIFDGRGPVTREIQEHVNRKTRCYSVRFKHREISKGDVLLLAYLKPKSISFVKCYGLNQQALKDLAANEGLQAFSMEDCNKFPLGGLKVWQHLPELGQLSLIGAGLADADLKSLSGLDVSTFSLARNPQLTFDGIRQLGGRDKQTYLFVSENQMRRITPEQQKELLEKRKIKLMLEKFNMVRKGNLYTYFDENEK